jgi:hypothetical protein
VEGEEFAAQRLDFRCKQFSVIDEGDAEAIDRDHAYMRKEKLAF